jgi:cytochrome c peroxidase
MPAVPGLVLAVALWWHAPGAASPPRGGAAEVWSAAELSAMRSLSIDALPAKPEDPSNPYLFDNRAVALGQRLFFDPQLSVPDGISCATCHRPERAFTDGRRLAKGLTNGTRNAPTLIGAAWGRWFNWDGRADSLWAQAAGPLESPSEMGSTRGQLAHLIFSDSGYRAAYIATFGPFDSQAQQFIGAAPCGPVDSEGARACWDRLPERVRDSVTRMFVNVVKALAAYEATMRPRTSRFDRYVRALTSGRTNDATTMLDASERRGLRLFLDVQRTQCMNCHNGPLFTNGGFHNIGTNFGPEAALEMGRMLGLRLFEASALRCDGRFSDALPAQCVHTRFASTAHGSEQRGAFKVPTLRNVNRTAPYMHDGRMDSLRTVMAHYNAPPMPGVPGAHELKPLHLSEGELRDLAAFLTTLDDAAAVN